MSVFIFFFPGFSLCVSWTLEPVSQQHLEAASSYFAVEGWPGSMRREGRKRIFLNLLRSGAWTVSTAHSMFVSIPCRPVGDPSRPVSMPCQMMCWVTVSSLRRPRLEERGKNTSCKPLVLCQPSHSRGKSWGQSVGRVSISQAVEMKTRLLQNVYFIVARSCFLRLREGAGARFH